MSERKPPAKKMQLNPNANLFNIRNAPATKNKKDPVDPKEPMPSLSMYAASDGVIENIRNAVGGKKKKDAKIVKNVMFLPVEPPPSAASTSSSMYRANIDGTVAAGKVRVAAGGKKKNDEQLKSAMFGPPSTTTTAAPPAPITQLPRNSISVPVSLAKYGGVANQRGKTLEAAAARTSTSVDDDDMNDVVAMGGINIAEESRRIFDNHSKNTIDAPKIRSCGEEESFLNMTALQARLRRRMLERGLGEPSLEVAKLISEACRDRLKTTIEELVVAAKHRADATGSRKKHKANSCATAGSPSADPTSNTSLVSSVTKRDMIYFMEQDRHLCRSDLLYKAHLM